MKWSGRRDSNSRHLPWQGSALPAELLPRSVVLEKRKTPALTDFSGTLRSEYHRRCRVSRPCSAWRGVVPRRCGHGGICCCHGTAWASEGGVRGPSREQRDGDDGGGWSRPRLMSTSQLSALQHLHLWPLDPVVYRETYLSGRVGHLILGLASRLDAFSGYPLHT